MYGILKFVQALIDNFNETRVLHCVACVDPCTLKCTTINGTTIVCFRGL